MRALRAVAVVGVLLATGCGSDHKTMKAQPVACTGSPDCSVSKATLEKRDELREEQERERRADRRAKERDMMNRRN